MQGSPDRGAPQPRHTATLVVTGLLVLGAVVVFGFLPRLSAPPVVTTSPSASIVPNPSAPATPSPESAPSSIAVAAPDAPAAEAVPPPDPNPRPRQEVALPPSDPAPASEPPSPVKAPDVWAAAVTEGLAALDRGELKAAREAFARAEASQPGTAAVRDARVRLDAAEKALALDTLRHKAREAEDREDWGAALAAFDAAQSLDPVVGFAVEGRARAVFRHDLDLRLEGHLKRPDRLSTEAVAREAETTLERADEIEPKGPRLQKQSAALRAALATARMSIPVELVSDGLTDVTILRVGHLGPFKQKSLDLRPGAYVVVGTRKGYRDARIDLVVKPGSAPKPLRVQCEEAL